MHLCNISRTRFAASELFVKCDITLLQIVNPEAERYQIRVNVALYNVLAPRAKPLSKTMLTYHT